MTTAIIVDYKLLAKLLKYIVLLLIDWTARLFPNPRANEKFPDQRLLKKSSYSLEIVCGSSITIHSTISEQGGVVSEPS